MNNMENNTTALVPVKKVTQVSLIENISRQQVKQELAKIREFQLAILEELEEGKDYGIIPGCDKKTLLKPGAEKVLNLIKLLIGVTNKNVILDQIEDYNKGFFAYKIQCVLSKDGVYLSDGIGSCNTKEKKYQQTWEYDDTKSGKNKFKKGDLKQDAFSVANTVLKMAKKRAQVDAALSFANLSQLFTQDLDDFKDVIEADFKVNGQTGNGKKPLTPEQIKENELNKLRKEMIREIELLEVREQKEILLYISGLVGREIKGTKELSEREIKKVTGIAIVNQEEREKAALEAEKKKASENKEADNLADMFEKETAGGGAKND